MISDHVVSNNLFYKLIIFLAAVASLGTMPYGYEFAQGLMLNNQTISILIGIIFALSAAIANTALGAYSFLSIDIKQNTINPLYLAIASFLSAIPNGFMCYFAYQPLLPALLVIIMSFVVTMINAAIGYSAMFKFCIDMKSSRFHELSFHDIGSKLTGFLIGVTVSATVCMASFDGFINLFSASHWNDSSAIYLAYFIGFMTWVPSAALYSNTMQAVVEKCYVIFTNISKHVNKVNNLDITLLIFSCCSGFSFTQIAIDFFNPSMHIPTVLKSETAQLLIYNYLVPLAYVSSASLNYFALKYIIGMKAPANKDN